MMEEQRGNMQNSEGHACAMCHGKMMERWHGMCGHHVLLRWVVGLIILGIVFGLGVKIGEVKEKIETGYGYYGYQRLMMYPYGNYGYPLMGTRGAAASSTTASPAQK